ncbi:hypothetical protein DVH24_035560 [Malus domestica]|uniref:Uncharacterized protein n=1 Tax=Malus domestica TaxID=3750 RepID=A0A498J6I6_MALDO|nr:hypothetical protein DVH24_035560 [Malus domestica]
MKTKEATSPLCPCSHMQQPLNERSPKSDHQIPKMVNKRNDEASDKPTTEELREASLSSSSQSLEETEVEVDI